jgi:urea carboxylase
VFKRVLIANRGEIACRIIRSLHAMGIEAVAVYSEEDAHALHVRQADHAILLGPAAARESYLNVAKVLEAAKKSGAEAIHPGYGFLSENAAFAESCEQNGITFIGPSPDNIRAFGLKHEARAIAERMGVPLLPGTGLLADVSEALAAAEKLGYPVMLKSVAGGGGIGLQRCNNARELEEKLEAVQRLSQANFGQSGVFLEKFIVNARHIEAQMFGDGLGKVLVLGERDCSTQRRNQKVIEETPAPHLSPETRKALLDAARKMGEAVQYRSAGTVEFVCDADTGAFYFLEVNTRLQVEHGVTELVTGIDLVEWMIRLAAGQCPALDALPDHAPGGHAIQARVYAEDANKQFQPSSGRLIHVHFPEGVRCDRWVENGTEVSPFYDPLLAKVLVHAKDRKQAVQAMETALDESRVDGIESNLSFLRAVLRSEPFQSGNMTTGTLARLPFHPRSIDILSPGISTTIQDYPGRLGYWMPGIPPSGPMDHLSFRIGNRLLGNAEGAPGLELVHAGPKIRFNSAMRLCLTGAACDASLDGVSVPLRQVFEAPMGSTLTIGRIGANTPGCRAYLLFEGGLDVPDTLGSASTFAIGGLGGLAGRPLRAADVVHVRTASKREIPLDPGRCSWPSIPSEMHIGVLYGPHAAPEFFKHEDIETLLGHAWEVHHNSDRTGVRLIGPKPVWARKDGGEAGLHPSNIHDTMYAVGAIDFTGDMPIILGVDGPSQGGFCCPVVIASAELWKVGQLRAGMKVRFHVLSTEAAMALQTFQDQMLAGAGGAPVAALPTEPCRPDIRSLSDVLARMPAEGDHPEVTYRMAGDRSILIEYGPMRLDLVFRFRVQALLERLQQAQLEGVIELSPAVRSLQVLYDSRKTSQAALLKTLIAAERTLPDIAHMVIRSRVVKLPLSWNDPQAVLAMTKYAQVRENAPWCPDNIEFIRRINGLNSQEEVKAIVFGATYLVLGLGNVYFGAPCTTPMDPRHRLVTTKYNPARTWTPENAVGIGGAYLGIYGMEGPGGYQLVGRTCQIFNRYAVTQDFPKGHPWLLNAFDQIRFYPVSPEELIDIRSRLLQGSHQLEVEEVEFHPSSYLKSLESIREETEAFEKRRSAAFQAERAHWEAIGEFSAQKQAAEQPRVENEAAPALAPGQHEVLADMAANVWKVMLPAGTRVAEGEVLFILEAMKMELPIVAPCAGILSQVLCEAGKMVAPGQRLAVVEPEPPTPDR